MATKFTGLSALALIGANLIPLFGVLFYGWNSVLVLALFWIENLIIGAFNLLKMLAIMLRNKQFGGIFLSGFFVLHYGLFCTVHGAILWDILNLGKLDVNARFPGIEAGFLEIFAGGATVLLNFIDMFGAVILLGIAALTLSHLVSFIENFVLKGEIFKQTINGLMGKPYPRILVLHIGLILGAFALQKFGSPVWLLVMVVLFKILMDLMMHLGRRRKSAALEMVKDL